MPKEESKRRELLYKIGRVVSSELDLESLLKKVAALLKRSFRFDYGAVFLRAGEELQLKALFNSRVSKGAQSEAIKSVEKEIASLGLKVGKGITGAVAETGEPILSGDVGQDARYLGVHEEVKSELCVPLRSRGRVIGVVNLESKKADAYSREDLDLLLAVAGEVGVAMENARLFKESKKKLSQLSALYEASRTLTTSLDVDKILNAVVQEAMKLMDTRTASIMLLDEREELRFRIAKGLSPKQIENYNRRPLKRSDELSRRMAEGKAPLLADDLDQVPGLRETLLRKDTESFYSFPLISKDKVIGVLNVSSPRPHRISKDEVEVFTSLANQAAVVIENAELYEQTKRRVKEVSAIRDVAVAIGSILDPKELLAKVTSVIRKSLGYPYVAIFLIDEKPDELRLEAADGYQGVQGLKIRIGEQSIGGWVAKEGKPALVPDVRADSRYLEISKEVRSEVCVPLKKENRVVGVLDVSSKEVGGLTEGDLRTIEDLAFHISISLENAKLYQKLSDSYRDADRLKNFSQSILQNIPSGIVTVDKEGEITLVNRMVEELLGYSKKELVGSYVEDFFSYPGGPPSPLLATLKEGKELVREEIVVRNKDGKLISIGFSTSPLSDEKGEVVGASGILKDLTETKEMERRLLRADRLAGLGEMAAGVAHEVKNPLAGIRAGVEYLSRETSPDSPEQETVKLILNEVSRLDRIVGDMTSFAYRPPLELSELDVDELLESSLKILEKEIEEGGVVMKRELNPQLPTIVGDGSQLSEVFINLFLNSLQAMKGGGELTVRTDYLADEDMVEIEIQDTGSGIAFEHLPKIFNPFFTTKRGGTGLGLSIVHRIVEDHNGSISAASKSGQGSTFRVKLLTKGFDHERGPSDTGRR